jgi:hypothetical protein
VFGPVRAFNVWIKACPPLGTNNSLAHAATHFWTQPHANDDCAAGLSTSPAGLGCTAAWWWGRRGSCNSPKLMGWMGRCPVFFGVASLLGLPFWEGWPGCGVFVSLLCVTFGSFVAALQTRPRAVCGIARSRAHFHTAAIKNVLFAPVRRWCSAHSPCRKRAAIFAASLRPEWGCYHHTAQSAVCQEWVVLFGVADDSFE